MSLRIFFSLAHVAFLLFLVSCGSQQGGKKYASSSATYILTDKAGKFIVSRESGISSNKKSLVLKQKVYLQDNKEKVLEKTLIISDPGYIKGKFRTLRPKKSLYNVWFDGKKYSTEMDINIKNKSLSVKLVSPEKQWSGTREIPFPKNSGPFCFFNQLIECLRTAGFLDNLKNGSRKKIYIIWESYPYIQEQYLNLPNEVFSSAEVTYDGLNEQGEKRITLDVAGHAIFYLLSKTNKLNKIFWVSQGLSIVKERKSN